MSSPETLDWAASRGPAGSTTSRLFEESPLRLREPRVLSAGRGCEGGTRASCRGPLARGAVVAVKSGRRFRIGSQNDGIFVDRRRFHLSAPSKSSALPNAGLIASLLCFAFTWANASATSGASGLIRAARSKAAVAATHRPCQWPGGPPTWRMRSLFLIAMDRWWGVARPVPAAIGLGLCRDCGAARCGVFWEKPRPSETAESPGAGKACGRKGCCRCFRLFIRCACQRGRTKNTPMTPTINAAKRAPNAIRPDRADGPLRFPAATRVPLRPPWVEVAAAEGARGQPCVQGVSWWCRLENRRPRRREPRGRLVGVLRQPGLGRPDLLEEPAPFLILGCRGAGEAEGLPFDLDDDRLEFGLHRNRRAP